MAPLLIPEGNVLFRACPLFISSQELQLAYGNVLMLNNAK